MLNASIQTFTQALLVTNIRAQGIENKEKCSSRFHQMSFNSNWIILAGTMMHITVRCFKKKILTFCLYHHRRPVLYIIWKQDKNIIMSLYLVKCKEIRTVKVNISARTMLVTSSIHRTLSNPLAFPLQTLPAEVG